MRSHAERYLSVFIENNEQINPENHYVGINTKVINADEYVIEIGSNIYSNIYFLDDYNDTIYFCDYRGFVVLIFSSMLIKEGSDKRVFAPLSSEGHIPVSYNGALWELRIKGNELVDFSYFFCECDTAVFERLKSVPIID